ncbi:MAG: type IV pilus modification protein PilV [Agarilytica sp.]
MRRHSPNHQSGVSLIEILVALFTLSIGLLGLATMQAKTLQLNQSAYQRTQATMLAKDVIDRIRANGSNVGDYVTDYSYSGSAIDCSSSSCNSNQMALSDIDAWQNLVDQNINGAGSIQLYGTADGVAIYDISIQWEDRDGNTRTFLTRATF